jgi:hypothetical protein
MDADEQHEAQDHHQQSHDVLPCSLLLPASGITLGAVAAMR